MGKGGYSEPWRAQCEVEMGFGSGKIKKNWQLYGTPSDESKWNGSIICPNERIARRVEETLNALAGIRNVAAVKEVIETAMHLAFSVMEDRATYESCPLSVRMATNELRASIDLLNKEPEP